MAEIALARVDARMIHGAVVTTWVPFARADILIAVDDETAKDEFICTIMKNCALNVRSEVFSAERFVELWKSGRLKNRRILVVFKSIEMAYKSYKLGLPFDELQLGYMIAGKENTIVCDEKNVVRVSPSDIERLKELHEQENIRVYMQYSPQFTPVEFTKYEV